MTLNFYLDDIEVYQPIGFADIELSIIRDEEYHGIGFEATTGTIEFYGTGADYLRTKKETDGINANVVFRAEVVCNAYQEEENIFTGRVNFGTYQEKCGDSCTISVGLEEDSCIVTLRNRIDQQVDIDSLVAFDKMTALPDYVMMGEEITLVAQEQLGLIEGSVSEAEEINFSEIVAFGDTDLLFRPTYDTQVSNNLATGYLIPNSTYEQSPHSGENTGPVISPQFFNEEQFNCFNGVIEYTFVLKGSFDISALSGTAVLASTSIDITAWNGVGNRHDNSILIDTVDLGYSGNIEFVTINGTFDEVLSGNYTLLEGYGIYCALRFEVGTVINTVTANVTFDLESAVSISANRVCPATATEYYMIHETLSRAVESITNGCARVKSSYYGRTDSEPFAFDEDGCGGVRMFTSGLKIRRAQKDYFFTSFKKLLDGVNAIDNIGFGLEDDPVLPNKKVVRIEAVDYFYQDSVLLTLPSIPSALSEVKEDMYVSTIKIGYKKWEVETINGLDEVNSTREYRTNFEVVNNTLDLESELVAGAYAIEITRQQSFVDSGGADTTYDNDTFIICLLRQGYNTFTIDTNQIQGSPENIYSPETKYNFLISPARNMLRWMRSVINGYTNIADTNNKIFFSSGTGNIDASIRYIDDCYFIGDIVQLSEKQDLTYNTPITPQPPIWKNETITFEYPLSVSEYRAIKAAPYGTIRYQCGTGDFKDGFIKEIKYQPIRGTATFVLIKKYGV